MEAQIKVEGARELRRNLRKIQKDLPKGMKVIHDKIAQPVVSSARRRARKRSGRMAGTIKSKATQTMARIQAGPLIYAPVQHWGWPGHSIEPNEFLTEALEENVVKVVGLYEKELNNWLERTWVDS